MHDAFLAIYPDVRLHPEKPLVAFARLMHLRVAGAGRVLSRRWCMDNRRVHNRARANADAAIFQVVVDRVQHGSAQIMPLQKMAEVQDGLSSGAAARPRSTPANRRSAGESYNASSAPGSDRLNQCWRK